MASEDALRKADFHRKAVKALSTSQNSEIRQLAEAVLESMEWLDSNFTDLQEIFQRVCELESDVEQTNDRLEEIENQLRRK